MNRGGELPINFERLLNECPAAKKDYDKWLAVVKQEAEKLNPGKHRLLSDIADSHTGKDNKNWYFAVAGFRVIGEAIVTVEEGKNASMKNISMDFTYHFRDPYKWDRMYQSGPAISHAAGLSRQYMLVGQYKKKYTWSVKIK